MRLVKLGDHWVNPEHVLAVWPHDDDVDASALVLLCGFGPLSVSLAASDVVAALTQPKAAAEKGRAVWLRRDGTGDTSSSRSRALWRRAPIDA